LQKDEVKKPFSHSCKQMPRHDARKINVLWFGTADAITRAKQFERRDSS
jgi:hypothetical protein